MKTTRRWLLGGMTAFAAVGPWAGLRQNFVDHGDCLQTGFLGTSILMDTLTEHGMTDVAYTLLLQHKNPSWLYSVDQGATTVWERWNSYTKKDGFGPVDMNSFNHYAYGAVLAWIYKTAAGLVKSAWRYDGDKWLWDFTVPEGATASVTLPRETSAKKYEGGDHHVGRMLK